MGHNELETDLRKILAQIDRWREIGYMPTIEQGIALGRLQKIYNDLLDLPCGEPEPTEELSTPIDIQTTAENTDTPIATEPSDDQAPAQATEIGYGEFDAPDDESFEPCCDPDVTTAGSESTTKGDDDGNFTDLSAEEGHRKSGETFLKQEYGAKDLCPPPTEFPEIPNDTCSEETEDEQQDESNPVEPITEGAPSEETHLMQEFGTHDVYPCQTEVPGTDLHPAEEPNKVPETEKKPDIFGIEVSPYARHEIIDTLFHGNIGLFDAECAKISAMSDLEEALVYIGETYNWIPENAATIKFIDLLETRFSE